MLKCDTDEKYMETYISYVTTCLQMHIIEKVGGRKQPGNHSRTFKNIKRTIEKGAVKKATDEGKPSVDVQKIESDILKVQADIEVARKFLRDYDLL
jgi:CRISPR/Cas system-associated exonuclease Cas4 (RecB family)